jgi:predicted patatin/cPLA2 family phospholipase
VIGTFSGSINAAFFASGQTATVVDLWANYVPGKHFISWRRQLTPFGGPGLAVDDMLDRVMVGQSRFDPVAATRGDPTLYVAVTDVGTGEGVLVKPDAHNVVEWLRASLALPVGYNRVVRIDGRGFIDGGVALPVPFDEPLAAPCEGPTVVVLTRKMHTLKPAPKHWERLFIMAIVPREARAATLRQHELHNAVMRRLSVAVERKEVLLVNPPDDMPLSRFTRDPGSIRAGIALGMEVGRRIAPDLLRAPECTPAELAQRSARVDGAPAPQTG